MARPGFPGLDHAAPKIAPAEDASSETAIVLVELGFDRVGFVVEGWRRVDVRVGSGTSWLRAVRFPHVLSEAGESLGDDLDELVCLRAAEELVRLEAAVQAIEARRAA